MNKIRGEIERKIVLSKIGRGTIEKQFVDYFFRKHPTATADEVFEAYDRFVDDVTGAYVRAGYGSTLLTRYLHVYGVSVSEKTILDWLREHDVTIRPPTRERERIIRTKWERNLVEEIKTLKEDKESLKKRYDDVIDELVLCESDLRMCNREKMSLTKKLETCEQEIKEIALHG